MGWNTLRGNAKKHWLFGCFPYNSAFVRKEKQHRVTDRQTDSKTTNMFKVIAFLNIWVKTRKIKGKNSSKSHNSEQALIQICSPKLFYLCNLKNLLWQHFFFWVMNTSKVWWYKRWKLWINQISSKVIITTFYIFSRKKWAFEKQIRS